MRLTAARRQVQGDPVEHRASLLERERAIVEKLTVPRVCEPGRHAALAHDLGDRLRALPEVLVALEHKGRLASLPVAGLAALDQESGQTHPTRSVRAGHGNALARRVRDRAALGHALRRLELALRHERLERLAQELAPARRQRAAESVLLVDAAAVAQDALGVEHADLGRARRAQRSRRGRAEVEAVGEGRAVGQLQGGDLDHGRRGSDVEHEEAHSRSAELGLQLDHPRRIALRQRTARRAEHDHRGALARELVDGARQVACIREAQARRALSDVEAVALNDGLELRSGESAGGRARQRAG